jgi:hypothetical protein
LAFANPTFTDVLAMTTASPAACQRVNPRRQPPTLPPSYTTTRDTTRISESANIESDATKV